VANGERGYHALALQALGHVEVQVAPLRAAAAEAHYRDALASAEVLEMRPLQSHCHLGLGKLYRRVGRLNDAHTELSTAISMLREMGMAFWLPEAEAEMAGVGGPAPRPRLLRRIACDG
jgi:hypothetical protein